MQILSVIMEAYVTGSARSVVQTVTTFTDEIEGELEKKSICGIHFTRKITLSLLGIIAVSCMAVGTAMGIVLSSSLNGDTVRSSSLNGDTVLPSSNGDSVDHSTFSNEHRYSSLRDVIESSVGTNKLNDNITHEHEALLWLANEDPLQIDFTNPDYEILQRFVIANLYFATKGTGWTEDYNFLSKTDVCNWNDKSLGVFCDESKRVSKILMEESNLDGTIPHEIGLLSHMEVFNLSGNNLVGTIPLSIGGIDPLKRVDLSYNDISGEIPPTVAMLLNLVELNLSFNSLVGGDGSVALNDLPSLKEVYLSNNRIDGELGPLVQSSSLHVIDLSSNLIEGAIPRNFGESNNLKILNLSANSISGTIPESIGKFHNLVELDLSDNELSGSLPATIGELTTLKKLNLGSNAFDDDLPTELGNLAELGFLDVSDNLIESVPGELFTLKNLQVLNLSNNNIWGSLPSEIGLATSLVALDLSSNDFTHKLPYAVSQLTILESLYLNDNQFDGSIPSDLGSLFMLRQVDFSNNHFFGSMELLCADRPSWGNPIEAYSANCLSGEITLSCATKCCDERNYCCDMPNKTDCKMRD